MEEGDLAAVKSTAAALGGWIVFEDECGQSMRPPRSRTWGRRGITPVIRVRGGGTGHVSVAGLACYRPGCRSRLIYRLHSYRGRKDETKAFTWIEYRDLLIAAHRQLPGGNIVLIWDYVPRHIIRVLCPAVLCGRRRLAVLVTGGDGLGGAVAGHIMITARRAS